jgi:hypothetical protein
MERVSYRLQMEYCEQRARMAPTGDIAASWQRLAAGWRSLISNPGGECVSPKVERQSLEVPV